MNRPCGGAVLGRDIAVGIACSGPDISVGAFGHELRDRRRRCMRRCAACRKPILPRWRKELSTNEPVARMLADSFAGTSLRPPLSLALDRLVESFSLGDAE